MEHIPASDYVAATAEDAYRKSEAALAKSKSNEDKIDEIHLMLGALLLGTFGKNSTYWINEARKIRK